jgi:hypothetical protein
VQQKKVGKIESKPAATWRLVIASLSTTGELVSSSEVPNRVVMADAWNTLLKPKKLTAESKVSPLRNQKSGISHTICK